MQKKFILFLVVSFFIFGNICFAQDAMREVLISQEVESKITAKKAQEEAHKSLKEGPKALDIKIKNIQKIKRAEKNLPNQMTIDYGEAPFGTFWGYSVENTKKLGIILKDISSADNARTFSASYLPKGIPDFDEYVLYFGIENKLWHIISYGKPIKDESNGVIILKLYDKYVRLLNIKYGNRKEYFSPRINIIEEIIPPKKDDRDAVPEIIRTEVPEEIGSNTFIQDIKSGESSLYSTFYDEKIGVILSVKVNKEGNSYITIDYKNLDIIKEREEKTLGAI